jgi:hypothetical protein
LRSARIDLPVTEILEIESGDGVDIGDENRDDFDDSWLAILVGSA